MKAKIVFVLLVSGLSCISGFTINAETRDYVPKQNVVWYVGIDAGVPSAFSTLSSFGSGAGFPGYAAGVYGGCRFSPVLSAELSLKFGKTALSARGCCLESSYWLGPDGVTYYAPVAVMDGFGYQDLKSDVSLQEYGVRLNVNLLGLFEHTRHGRWALEVSPTLAAVGTNAILTSISSGTSVKRDGLRWHLGAGGRIQAGYALTDRLSIGIYTGLLHLTGSRIDGMAEQVHKSNFLWDSGIRIGWTFGRSRRKSSGRGPVAHGPFPEVCNPVPVPVETPASGVPEPADGKAESAAEPDKALAATEAQPAEIADTPAVDSLTLSFPSVYFDFNGTDIRPAEDATIEEEKEM